MEIKTRTSPKFYELENKVSEQLVSRCDRSSINYFLYNGLPSVNLTCQLELMLSAEYLFLKKYSWKWLLLFVEKIDWHFRLFFLKLFLQIGLCFFLGILFMVFFCIGSLRIFSHIFFGLYIRRFFRRFLSTAPNFNKQENYY